ncbi:uncharacterized protein LOC115703887 [Cannabis sativa]|uniref:uncharacterized protein LOC115703887 n=1 Tax=Cannabis sativa TaxID=3483 RepID=UPI0029CA720C|nr:uncharacterized protein LOC115703887 [Cannabis sativa]
MARIEKYFKRVDPNSSHPPEVSVDSSTNRQYSINEDSAFCLYCYLFKQNKGKQGGGQTFVSKGFSNWKKPEILALHVGKHDSSHYEFESIRFLLRQGLAFHGHDESEDSNNQGTFPELLNFLADHNEEVRAVVLKNAPENLRLNSPKIQKDIVNACAVEIISVIIKDMEDVVVSILVDESRDVSIKEQMVVMFRYVDKKGYVIERFIGIEHVENTTAISLKIAIDKLFSKHGLNISRLRGQEYDGASNMSGEFNSLKSIIMKENECAFYVHCFAHQLQLALMGVAKKHDITGTFLTMVSNVVNIVGALSKHRDILREKQAAQVIEALKCGKLSSGKGLNQENGIKRPCKTRWGITFWHFDLQLQELNNRFNEANTELLLCLACLSPNNSFYAFDKKKLLRLALLYPHDFSVVDLRVLEFQLQTYVDDLHSHAEFSELKGIADLSIRLVETRKHEVCPLVYLLIKSALTLPVATTSVERAFLAMNIVKNQMRNKMEDQWLNDGLTVYLEKDVFNTITNESIIHRFQNMKTRRG